MEVWILLYFIYHLFSNSVFFGIFQVQKVHMSHRYISILFWLSIFVYLLLGMNSFIFTYPDEGRNAFATLYMIKSGEYIVPYYNGEIRYDKPPLLYYLAAISYKFLSFFGVEKVEFSFRLVSALATFFSSIIVYELSKYFISGLFYRYFSVVVYVSLSNVFVESKAFVPEPLLSLFINLCLLSFYKIYHENNLRWNIVFWISLGLGMLAKGIIAVIIVFLVIFCYLLIKKDLGSIKLIFRNLYSVFLGLLVGVSWFVMVGIKTQGDFIYKFIMIHNLGRFTGTSKMHLNPLYFYIIVIFVNIVPLFEIFAVSLYSFIRSLLDKQRTYSFPPNFSFLFVYFLSIFIFYSLSQGKVHHYIMPCYIPFSILLAYFTEKYISLYFNRLVLLLSFILPLLILFQRVSQDFILIKNALLVLLTAFNLVYFIIPKRFLVIAVIVKIFLFYMFIVSQVDKSFPNQNKLLELIKDNYILKVGDISTLSFYNLYINNCHKTPDLFYAIQLQRIDETIYLDIVRNLENNRKVIIFTKPRYLQKMMRILDKLRISNLDTQINKVTVAQSVIFAITLDLDK
ncbi:MAG: glycosyltransferase family 39 protein [bacterium]